jgi:ubiquinone/menaquinone biosynthesis C-methylase UbiE
LSKESWSNYWAEGNQTSFINMYEDGYDGEIAQFWQKAIDGLPGDQVLDLCSGSGGLARLLSKLINHDQVESPVKIIATDYSDIKNEEAKIGNVTISKQGRINCEALPFDEGEFELVTSQFGAEYSDLNKTINEAFRVLKSNGRFALLCHSTDSLVCRQNALSMKFVVKLVDSKLSQVLYDFKMTKLQNDDLTELKGKMNSIFETLYQLSPNDFQALELKELTTNVLASTHTDHWQNILSTFDAEIGHYLTRAKAMDEAALSNEQIVALNDLAIKTGFKPSAEPQKIQKGNELLGVGFIFHK